MLDVEFLQQMAAKALQVVAHFRSAGEVDGFDLTHTLYLIRVAFDRLWPPPKQPIDGAEGIDAQHLADDLGLLASLPKLPTDTRGFV